MLHTLDGDGNWIAKAQVGWKMIPALLSFIGERNEILLNRNMGVGEYQHIYALSYFVLLDKDPGDGPGFVLAGDDEAEEEREAERGGLGAQQPARAPCRPHQEPCSYPVGDGESDAERHKESQGIPDTTMAFRFAQDPGESQQPVECSDKPLVDTEDERDRSARDARHRVRGAHEEAGEEGQV